MKNQLFILSVLLFVSMSILSCREKVNPNEWVVSTNNCWNTLRVSKAGDVLPRTPLACDRIVILPATELAGEFEVETKFMHRLAGKVKFTYQWMITNPAEFIKSAKSITSSPTNNHHKIDPDRLEEIENNVVDKMLKDIIREYTPTINPKNIDELELERAIIAIADSGMSGRGVSFRSPSVNVDLSEQAEAALDNMAALQFYKDNGEEEFGRQLMLEKAGASNILIQTENCNK